MNLTEEQLRDRGILRSVEEMVAEAEEMVALSVGAMPVGRRVEEPERELTRAEAEALERGGLDLSGPPSDAEPGARLARTAARYAAMLASSLTVAETAALLGVSGSRIRQRVAERTLYFVRTDREVRLPRFQFAEGEVPGVREVLREIRADVHPISVENWFTQPGSDLFLDEDEERPVSPRDWLLSGGSPEVLVALAREL